MSESLDLDRIDLCWPESTEGTEPDLDGYVMPRLHLDYYFDVTASGGRTKTIERSLDWAVPTQRAFSVPFSVSAADRLELTRLVAQWLTAMHGCGLVYGDLSWKNITFTVSPTVRISVFDFDSTRRLGAPSFTGQQPANTVDWDDPETGPHAASWDSDRYRFALLAYRLLVSGKLHGPIDPAQVPASITGLSEVEARALARLWRRASGPGGTRPTMTEWTAALGTPLPAPGPGRIS